MKDTLFRVVSALVFLGGALLGYGVWYSVVSATSRTVATLSEEIAVRSERVQQASVASAALRKLESVKSELANYFVSEKSIVPFLAELEQLGTRLGTTMNVVSVGAPTEVGSQKGEQPLPVILSAEGSFDAVMRTLGAIEQAPYALSITAVTLDRAGEDPAPQWKAAFTILVGLVVPTANVKSPASEEAATSTSP